MRIQLPGIRGCHRQLSRCKEVHEELCGRFRCDGARAHFSFFFHSRKLIGSSHRATRLLSLVTPSEEQLRQLRESISRVKLPISCELSFRFFVFSSRLTAPSLRLSAVPLASSESAPPLRQHTSIVYTGASFPLFHSAHRHSLISDPHFDRSNTFRVVHANDNVVGIVPKTPFNQHHGRAFLLAGTTLASMTECSGPEAAGCVGGFNPLDHIT